MSLHEQKILAGVEEWDRQGAQKAISGPRIMWDLGNARDAEELVLLLKSTWGKPIRGMAQEWMEKIGIGTVNGSRVELIGPEALQRKLASVWTKRGGTMGVVTEHTESLVQESTTSLVTRTIRNSVLVGAEEKLNAIGKHYDSKFSITGSAHGVEVRMWITVPPSNLHKIGLQDTGSESEARTVAETLLGSGFTLEPHKLKKDQWVAKVTYQLADIF
jgi:hypothetical protein